MRRKRLGVRLWHLEEYLPHDGPMDTIVPLNHIKGYLALKTVTVGALDMKVWATIPLDNVSVMSRWLAIIAEPPCYRELAARVLRRCYLYVAVRDLC